MGAAVVTVVAATAAIAAGLSTGSTGSSGSDPAKAFSNLSAINRAATTRTGRAHTATVKDQGAANTAKARGSRRAAAGTRKTLGQHSAGAQHPARHSTAPRPAKAPSTPAAPYLMYDSVLPSAIPTGAVAAVYVDGPYAASPAELTRFKQIVWIDTNGSDPAADALDTEPGDATPAQAAQWADQRLTQYPHALAVIYTMLSEWQAVQDDVAGLPQDVQARVRYWIADPTG
jgi:hypothetical protein